jgi:hypothetical protein
MLFGKKIGVIIIKLEKTDFFPGEYIKGNISLDFEKSILAEGLKVAFIGEKIGKAGLRAGGTPVRYPFHRNEIQIEGKKEYYQHNYPFEIVIPSDIFYKAENWKDYHEDVFNRELSPLQIKTAKMMKSSAGLKNASEEYFVEVVLPIHKSKHVIKHRTERIKINIKNMR